MEEKGRKSDKTCTSVSIEPAHCIITPGRIVLGFFLTDIYIPTEGCTLSKPSYKLTSVMSVKRGSVKEACQLPGRVSELEIAGCDCHLCSKELNRGKAARQLQQTGPVNAKLKQTIRDAIRA
ncbi:NifU-related protein [Cordyceps militaris]|uniref:NifU-related protein n=1 Tax=Cordyceps militaris TaxID=73501 RepID=A0A2H4SN77_CORMI|nr:NifU-related protein [Cordyceps militaris]